MTGGSAAFPDHFSSVAASYATFRPHYPTSLFEWLAGAAPARSAVWDCACGSGQATAGLAEYFDLVIATDASAQQLSHAPPVPLTIYQLATAEESGLPDASVDAVVVAQALHWFDLARFWPEVRRIVRPGGLVAAWCYGPTRLREESLNRVLHWFYDDLLGPWWPENRRHVDAGYTTIDFPFPRLTPPAVELRLTWTLPQFLGYLHSWSAAQRYQSSTGLDPFPELMRRLGPLWGDGTHEVEWPVAMLAGRNLPADS